MTALLQVDDIEVHFPITRGVLVHRTVGHVRAVDPDTALVVAGTVLARGGRGLQTQLWQRFPDRPGHGGSAAADGHDRRSSRGPLLGRPAGNLLNSSRNGRNPRAGPDVTPSGRRRPSPAPDVAPATQENDEQRPPQP